MPARRPLILVVLLTTSLLVTLAASGPTFWTVATSADFLAGRSDGVFVSLEGVVTPGPRLTSRLGTAPPQVWALATAPDGTLWAGTGGEGHVLRIPPGQQQTVVFDAPEPNVFAIALSGTRVYAATGPDGAVHAIEADGTSRVFFDPAEKYIWALAVDRDGRLWVGAGNPAVIYRVDASGNGEAVYHPPASHVVSLGFDNSGALLAGTESPGRLYRLEPSGRPFVVLDSGFTELRAVASAPDGTLFAAAVNREGAAAASGETTSVAAAAAPAPATGGSGSSSASTGSRSRVFRIAPDGTWETLWETADTIYDIATADNGSVLVATGSEGRLYRLGADRSVSLLTGVDAGQVTRFAPAIGAAGVAAFATANPGRVISIGTGSQSPATYLSPVRDTRTVATWGLIRWESTGPVTLATRTGNTAKPDDSWSDWSSPYSDANGHAISSPPARFIQWRAVLETRNSEAPSVSAVTVAYLPRNTRPSVTEVTVHPPGVVFQRPFSNEDGAIAGLDDLSAVERRPPGDTGPPSSLTGRRMFQRGLQTLAWKAEDADGDRLIYSLSYRRDGDSTWHELRTGLLDAIFVWDTTTVADGRYVVRLDASDELSNSVGQRLTGQLESSAIVVDNTPPTISATATREADVVRLRVDVRDAQSPIQKLEYSVAGGSWQLVFPLDGLADSRAEVYEVRVSPEQDLKDVVLRATDLLQNVTSVPAAR